MIAVQRSDTRCSHRAALHGLDLVGAELLEPDTHGR
jgi:hypothetical protein